MDTEGAAKSPAAKTLNVICMKWGRLYGPEYVNNLHSGVTRHLKRPHRFVCFTDDPLGLNSAIETFPLPKLGLPPDHKDALASSARDIFFNIDVLCTVSS